MGGVDIDIDQREFQLPTGRWATQVTIFEKMPDGVVEHLLPVGPERSFPSREEAKAFGNSEVSRWLQDHGQS